MRLSLLLFLFSMFAFSQNLKKVNIEYDVLHRGIINKEFLSYSNNEIISFSSPYSAEEIKGYDENDNLRIRRSAELPQISFFKKVSNDTVVIKFHLSKEILALDKTPHISWSIDNNTTKNIGGFICHYATAKFRGSDVYAFFTTDIPISLGPWKFNGLPGAILECGSTDLLNVWKAIKISLKDDPLIEREFIWDKQAMPYQTLVKNEQKKIAEYVKRQQTKLPKGYESGRRTSKINRLGIEQVYEWEW